ncbi:MAG: hypothetical protein WD824_09845 [Cyclobacteriaceae bacterium]
MRRPSRSGLSLVFALSAIIPLAAQNLESIGKEKPFSFAGGVSFNQIFYSSSGIASGRDPYSYYASANLNLSLYGWTVPLTFSLSNQNTSFSQPFNQYSVHPTYKWITAHVGYTSMSFSPYTVNGHVFLGGAIDLAPGGIWKFSTFYGRFMKAVEPDSLQSSSMPAFQRIGYGLKVTCGGSRNFIDMIVFHAEDDLHSIRNIPDSVDITPQQNLVLSFGIGKTLFKSFLLKAEFATSAMSKDTRANETVNDHPLAECGIFQPRVSSSYYNAFKTSFDYQRGEWRLGLAYERIDPGYRTLGAYYFNNDLENITLNGSTGMLQGKLNMAASAGIQGDNLDKTKISTMRRIVGSINITYTASQHFNTSASYSSFQTYTNIRSQFETINQLTPYDNLDTLNFTQISRNASMSAMYSLPGGENKKQNFNLQLTWQDAADTQGQVKQHSGTRFYNINTGYSITLVPQNISVAINFNTSINEGYHINNRTMGPGVTISRSFFKRKFRTTLSSSYNTARSNGVRINTAINGRLSGALSLHDKHNINLSAIAVNRGRTREGVPYYVTEFTGTMGYSYTVVGRRK